MENEILESYYDPKLIGSFSSIERLKSVNPKWSRKNITAALQKSPTYTQHKRVTHKFKRRKFNVHTSNYLWQADLVCLPKYKYQNSHNQYILTAIDVFSKKAYAQPLKKKLGEAVTTAFKKILATAKVTPKFLQVQLAKFCYRSLLDNKFYVFLGRQG